MAVKISGVRQSELRKWAAVRRMAWGDWLDELFAFTDEERDFIANHTPQWL